MAKTELLEREVYSAVCRSEGIKAKEIAELVGADRTAVNRILYNSPFMHELCYQDDAYRWHGLIRQARPHLGLRGFCGYYGRADEFLALSEEEWFDALLDGCKNIGRNLNDTRGLFHSFKDCRAVMLQLFSDLEGVYSPDWEIVFELRIKRARYIRIYADVLLITENKVFSLEFKMKDKIDPEEVMQAAKYCEYLEVLFGSAYDVIPCLVLTKAAETYTYAPLGSTDAVIPVCSGDMLFNIIDEYIGFLQH